MAKSLYHFLFQFLCSIKQRPKTNLNWTIVFSLMFFYNFQVTVCGSKTSGKMRISLIQTQEILQRRTKVISSTSSAICNPSLIAMSSKLLVVMNHQNRRASYCQICALSTAQKLTHKCCIVDGILATTLSQCVLTVKRGVLENIAPDTLVRLG